MNGILEKIKKAGIVGMGGARFSTAAKWAMIKNAAGEKKYVICNASEGEPGVAKDLHILENFAEIAIEGIKIAIDFLSAEKGYLFLNRQYNKKLNKKLTALLKDSKIEIFAKPANAGYIGGEESAILNAIEGKRIEPRLKPPFPSEKGLWSCPTLINNVETFYNISLVSRGKYENNRFYTIIGDCPNEGIYELPDDFTIEKVLNQTKNYPKFSFFVQAGGLASGEVFNSSQLKTRVGGAGLIAVFSLEKNNFKKIVKNWLNFFMNESCGQCVPCREGIYRLNEMLSEEKIDWDLFNCLLDDLSDASFCALGASAPVPIRSLIKNVYQIQNK